MIEIRELIIRANIDHANNDGQQAGRSITEEENSENGCKKNVEQIMRMITEKNER